MTRQQERAWQKKIDDTSNEVLQVAIEWEQNPNKKTEAALLDAVQQYKIARAGK